MNKHERILLRSSNIWYLGEGLLGPLFAVFAEKIGGDILEITWAWGVYLLTTGFLQIFFGRLSDRVSKKKLMFAGYFLNAVFTFCYLLVNNTLGLLLVQAGLGVAAAMATPTWEALYDKYSSDKKRGTLWGLADGQADIVLGVATLVGGFVLVRTSFDTLFILMGCIQIIAVVYLIRIFKLKR